MRLLFVSPTHLDHPRGGRAQLARLHHDGLRDLLGEQLAVHRLEGGAPGPVRRMLGQLDGADEVGMQATLRAVDAHDAQAVWLDGSNLGWLAQALRRVRPGVRTFTFCHNVEARFFLGAFRQARSIRTAGVVVGHWVAERLAVRYSDDLIALSRRDSLLFEQLYGRAADHLLPMAVTDQLRPNDGKDRRAASSGAPFLFVGGAFYANQAGVIWLAREVAPHVDASLQVIGQGMEAMKAVVGKVANVSLVGTVSDLEPYYSNASAVLAPIFDGSGMKTKVAEALMYGKLVIGTPEAFSGYAPDIVAANRCCADASKFIEAIRAVAAVPPPRFYPTLRALYERDHSPAATRVRLAEIINVGG